MIFIVFKKSNIIMKRASVGVVIYPFFSRHSLYFHHTKHQPQLRPICICLIFVFIDVFIFVAVFVFVFVMSGNYISLCADREQTVFSLYLSLYLYLS